MEIRQDREQRPTAAEVEAAGWLARQLSPVFCQKDRQEFDAWYSKSPDNASAYIRAKDLWNTFPTLIRGLSRLDSVRKSNGTKQRLSSRSIGRIAAAIVLAAIIPAALAWLLHIKLYNYSVHSKTTYSPQTVQVSVGMPDSVPASRDFAESRANLEEFSADERTLSSIFLPDGSVVTLSRKSRIRVQYTSIARAITLLEGRARFQVAKHQKSPFYVYAREQRVIATGTAFDVMLNNPQKSVEIALMEGSVTVDRPSIARHAGSIVANLTPGTQLTVQDGVPPLISPLRVHSTNELRPNRLVFSDAPLKALVQELNRYGGPQIYLGDEKLGKLRIDGRLRTDDPIAVARGIAQIYSLHMSEVNKKDIRLDWK